MSKKMTDGVYGVFKNGELKLHSAITDAELNLVEHILVKKNHTSVFMLRNEIEGKYNFDDAQKKAAECGAGWRCPTRHEWLDIHDMRFNGLDEFRKRLGMEPLNKWYWSCEEDADPQSSAQYAWSLNSHSSVNFNLYRKRYVYSVCAVSAFQI